MAAALTSSPTTSTRNDLTAFVGFKFSIATANTVTQVGRWKVSGNAASHLVKIADSGGADVSGASATVASGGTTAAYNYATLSTPVVLAAGTYWIGSSEVSGGDSWYNQEIVASSSDITVLNSAYRDTAWNAAAANQSFGPVNFIYTLGGTDTTAPVVASANVNSAGTTLTVNFTEAGSPPVLPSSSVTGFALAASGGAVTLSSTAISGTTFTATTSRTIAPSETLTLAYTPGNVTDSAATPNAMASFSGTGVTNNSTAGLAVAVTDANWHFSPLSGYSDGGGSVQANGVRSGSTYVEVNRSLFEFKLGFTGTSFRLNLDTSSLTAASIPTAEWPYLQYSIDGEAYNYAQVTTSQPIARTGLASGSHTIYGLVNRWVIPTTRDRWTTPAYAFRITGATIDAGSATTAPAGRVAIRPKVAMFRGDSITEAYLARQTLGSGSGTTDGFSSWALKVAAGMDAEACVDGWSGSSWATTGQGNVPAFYNTTSSLANFDKYAAGKSRLVAGKYEIPVDYDFMLLGANGGDPTTTVTAALPALRAAHQTTTWIFAVVPMGGQNRSGIAAGFAAYQAATPDPRCVLIDAGADWSTDAVGGGATAKTPDGLHVYDYAQADFASIVVGQAKAAMQPTPAEVATATWAYASRTLTA